MYPNHPSTTLPLASKHELPTIKLTLKTEPVLYNISYKDEISMRPQNKVKVITNGLKLWRYQIKTVIFIRKYFISFNYTSKARGIFRWLIPRRIVKIRNKQYSYSYQAEADLLRRDWESALERHSDRHPITYNRCMWMTTSHARKVLINLNKLQFLGLRF